MKRIHCLWRILSLILLFSLFFHIPAPCGAAEPKYLALTFDDGPSGKYTRRLLDGLAQRNARATFFLCGYRIETYPELTRELIESEHEIGLHGYSHDSMEKMSPAALNRELDQTEKLLENIAPCSVTLLRPPGGQSTKNVEKVAEQRGLSLIFWSVDPKDWATRDAAAVERGVLKNVWDGDIILLHDMSDSSVTAAFSIIDKLQAEGYCFVTVEELASLRGEALSAGSLYYSLPGPISDKG